MNGRAISRILYVRLDGIGDGILAGAFLEKLPLLFPRASITVLCDTACVPLYTCAAEADTIISINKHALGDPEALRKAIGLARQAAPDLTLNATLSPTRPVCELLLNTGAPLVSTEIDCANLLPQEKKEFEAGVGHLVPLLPGRRMDIERLADMLEALGLPQSGPLRPRFPLCPEAEEEAKALLRGLGLRGGDFVALFAGGSIVLSNYPRWGEALGPLCAERDFAVLALGGAEVAPINRINLESLARQGVRVHDLCGALSLQVSAALLKRAALAAGADTGLAHAACAFQLPLVAILGGGTFGRFLPYHPCSTAVCLPLDCYGCNWRCRKERAYCVADILPETLAAALNDALATAVPGAVDGKRPPRRTLFLQGPSAWEDGPGLPRWRTPGDFIAQARQRAGNPLRMRIYE